MTDKERDQYQKKKAMDIIASNIADMNKRKVVMDQKRSDEQQAIDQSEEQRNKLLEKIDENTRFFIHKMPNQDCLNCSQTIKEIALLDNSVKAFEKAFQLQNDANIILFILIEGY